MPKLLRVRTMTEKEIKTIEQLSHSRTAQSRQVERARIIQWASKGQKAHQIAARLGVTGKTVRNWLTRFNEAGLAGLGDEARAGRPPTYCSEDISLVVTIALTKPDDLALPFGHWNLDRLEAYLNEERGIGIKRSRINEILLAEGLRWRKEEHWLGERVDPDFAKKRGDYHPLHPTTRRKRRRESG